MANGKNPDRPLWSGGSDRLKDGQSSKPPIQSWELARYDRPFRSVISYQPTATISEL